MLSLRLAILVFLAALCIVQAVSGKSDENHGEIKAGGQLEAFNGLVRKGRNRRDLTCNDITGDFLCAGWAVKWRCTCGVACYNKVCKCKRCHL